ncbi:hypothetical protein [Gulosibacter sediminis]|uniref:hypothetical protein n=1 Tax=Gulosibacter sediminis TaxID=1729695 RepID=UPI001B7D8C73|nr:hypothetical protein [Gulosibacter sediminis]
MLGIAMIAALATLISHLPTPTGVRLRHEAAALGNPHVLLALFMTLLGFGGVFAALVTAGVETDVLGIWYRHITDAQRAEVTAAHPRPDFKNRILAAFTEGNVHRPDTTFGNVNADVLAHFLPGYERTDFVEIIRNSDWAE